MKRFMKITAIALALTLGMTTFAGCGGSTTAKEGAATTEEGAKTEGEKPAEGATTEEAATGESAEGQEFIYNLMTEPKTLDPSLNNAVDGAIVLVNLFEGLTNADVNQKPIPGVAEKWEASPDGLTYKFFLRKDAKWSDGQPVTAKDFVYSWKRAVDPSTAAEYGYQMYPLKNAQAINMGKDGKTLDDLGVKAIDDYTLEVTLENPTGYFMQLTSFPTYFPLREDIVTANPDSWATDAKTYISNGKYKISAIEPKSDIILEKNENYWDIANVKMAKVDFKMIEDPIAGYASFKAGDLHAQDMVPPTEIEAGVADGTVQILPYIGTYFYCLNVDKDKAAGVDPAAAKALADPKVRKALSLAIDRTQITKFVTKGGEMPAHGFVPTGIFNADGSPFDAKQYFKPEGDVEAAKKLLTEAGFADGAGFPKLNFIYNNGSFHAEVAQAVQDMWKKNLGLDVQLQAMEWKVLEQNRNDKNYVIARHGWIGDYADPMTFLDMWTSTSGQNNAGYISQAYDDAITAVKKEQDPTKRDEYMHKAEDVLMEDLPIIPIFYYTTVKAFQTNVKDVRVSPLGFVYFDQAVIEPKK